MELYRCWQCMNGMGQSNDRSDMQGYIQSYFKNIRELKRKRARNFL